MNEYIKWLAVIGTTFVITSLGWAGAWILTEEPEEPEWKYGDMVAGCDYVTIKIFTQIEGTGSTEITPDAAYAEFEIMNMASNETGIHCFIYIWR